MKRMIAFSMIYASLNLVTVANDSATPPSNRPSNRQLELFPIEKNIIQKTNQARRQQGLKPLVLDNTLMLAARRHASWMAKSNRLQHSRDRVAENIATGQSSSAGVLRDWMNSPGHRANILNKKYRSIGVAAYTSANGKIYWCQQFVR